jgi:hypothetical protein
MQTMTHRFTAELRRLERDSHEKCSSCGRPFRHADTAHAGYSSDGGVLFVGDCCKSQVAETAVRYYWMERAYATPEAYATLWRYMDFAKFAALLKDRSIYFARADQLGDPWEGAKGAIPNKPRWDQHYLRFFRESLRNPPPGVDFNLSDKEVEKEANRLLSEFASAGERDLRRTYVSCWHENEFESEALWRLYCPPQSPGIAIQTTLSALNASMGNDPSIQIGRVRYVDFRSHFAGINEAFFRKRQSLSHEREVRAVIRPNGETSLGVLRPAVLPALLKAIVISPFAPSWFEPLLREVMTRFGADAPTKPSDLLLQPFF